jgi:hypothetical protein
MTDIKTADMRDLLKDGAKLRFNGEGVRAFLKDAKDGGNADLAWLWDCATERGNSQASVWCEERDIDGERKDVMHFDFTQAGCCTLGIVMEVRYSCLAEKVPEGVLEKVEGDGVYPEDVIKEMGGFISLGSLDYCEVSYDPFCDEEEDGEDEDEDGED